LLLVKILLNPAGSNLYAQFIKDTLERFKKGREPIAGIRDALDTLKFLIWHTNQT